MKITDFRITNFRSIVDSKWVKFSPDGITVLVGQNESGKTSVLEALYFALTDKNPTEDDFRIGTERPKIHLRINLTPADINNYLEDLSQAEVQGLREFLNITENTVELLCSWTTTKNNKETTIHSSVEILDERLEKCVATAKNILSTPPNTSQSSLSRNTPETNAGLIEEREKEEEEEEEEETSIAEQLWSALPLGVLFNEETGRLPSQVDIDESGKPIGPGSLAARNFLKIAEINLPDLLKGDRRQRENTLNKANNRVSQDFNAFWSQSIGKSGKLTLKCDIDNYDASQADKAGKPHLVFWICDGSTQLYPKQRSQGVRWFVSFYLQLKASEKAKQRRVFLLDEPGANLHSKAQGDVLKLINQLGKETSTVVYSTHSPQMLEYPKLYRVHAVQRDSELDDAPTIIIDAHRLGTASSDTLSPVLTAMGADLSQHQVIRRTNNVLLEEMSGFYYINSFWKLIESQTEAHFIAATGVNKIEALANMFRGWGLSFITAIDDDKQGREVFNSMKRELYGDDPEIAKKYLLKLPDCPSIEDVFSSSDFAQFVLKEPDIKITGSNAEYLKNHAKSKPVAAFNFSRAVENGEIKMENLSPHTQKKIKAITDAIESRLKDL